jgi:inner membrane protein
LEPVTHFLTGACMGRAGFNRKTALATATMTLAAEAPDLDILGRFRGPVFGFAHHRGFTHSFLGLLIVSSVVVGFMYCIWRIRDRKSKYPDLPPRWGLLFALAYFAGLSHILLDFTNNYGVRPFWPFSERWYEWDIVFIVDPILLTALVAGLTLPALFALVDQEVGVRGSRFRGRAAALVALSVMVGLWAARDFEHRRAIAALAARTYQERVPSRVGAFPTFWNPFVWRGVVETPDFFMLTEVDSAKPEVDPFGHMESLAKPPEIPATRVATQTYVGRVYLDWAKFPVVEAEAAEGGGSLVHFYDLRFVTSFKGGGRRPLTAGVRLDENLNAVQEFMGMAAQSPPD